ncbi:unnamed protein product [Pleuronectes platessa]|uniref:Uncharacterized protein n=1 Tax=Pleuronectes platessa TaxID=8262 RepID=A0A9N7Z7F9_PLEPL|nr:unnamed protein product [Pleuronectes platessa]
MVEKWVEPENLMMTSLLEGRFASPHRKQETINTLRMQHGRCSQCVDLPSLRASQLGDTSAPPGANESGAEGTEADEGNDNKDVNANELIAVIEPIVTVHTHVPLLAPQEEEETKPGEPSDVVSVNSSVSIPASNLSVNQQLYHRLSTDCVLLFTGEEERKEECKEEGEKWRRWGSGGGGEVEEEGKLRMRGSGGGGEVEEVGKWRRWGSGGGGEVEEFQGHVEDVKTERRHMDHGSIMIKIRLSDVHDELRSSVSRSSVSRSSVPQTGVRTRRSGSGSTSRPPQTGVRTGRFGSGSSSRPPQTGVKTRRSGSGSTSSPPQTGTSSVPTSLDRGNEKERKEGKEAF